MQNSKDLIASFQESKGTFFKVLRTSEWSQIATMSLKSGEDSGPEDLHSGEQIILMIEGSMNVEVDHKEYSISKGEFIVIPPKTQHHLMNNSDNNAFFINVYVPPSY